MGVCKAAVVVKLEIWIFLYYAIYYLNNNYEPTLFMIWIFFYIDLLAKVYHPNLQLN